VTFDKLKEQAKKTKENTIENMAFIEGISLENDKEDGGRPSELKLSQLNGTLQSIEYKEIEDEPINKL
jgi:hypothetical protein